MTTTEEKNEAAPSPIDLASACAFLEPHKLVALLDAEQKIWMISRHGAPTLAQVIVKTAQALGWKAPSVDTNAFAKLERVEAEVRESVKQMVENAPDVEDDDIELEEAQAYWHDLFDNYARARIAVANVHGGATASPDSPLFAALAEAAYRDGYDHAEREFNEDHEAWEWPPDALAELRDETLPAIVARVTGRPATRLTPPAEVLAAAEALGRAIEQMEPCECAAVSGCPRAAAKDKVRALLEQWRGSAWLGR